MTDPHAAFDVPESDRIGELMSDLFGADEAPSRRHPTPRPATPRPTRRRAGKSRYGSTTVSAFAGAVNWKNAANFTNPLAAPAPPRFGGKTVAEFTRLANWRNAATETPVADPTPTLDTFLSEFNWD